MAVIVVFGTICLDRIRRIAALPAPGSYVEIDSEVLSLGGEAANTAAALANWGTETWLCGNDLGQGTEAEMIRSLLNANGIRPNLVGEPIRSGRPPVCDIYVTPDGDRTMLGIGFRDMEPVFVPSLIPMSPGKWFTAEPNMPVVSRQALRAASAAGMRTYLMDFVREDEPISPGSIWQTSTDWVGHRNEVFGNIEWLRNWIDKHGCFSILSDGANGFFAGSPDSEVRAYPPFPIEEVVDTTGAGDIFRAGMLFGLSQDWPIWRCLQFSAAAGALNCRTLSGSRKLPSAVDVLDLIDTHASVASQYR